MPEGTDERGEPKAVACPLCGKPALSQQIGGVEIISCPCMPKDRFRLLDLRSFKVR